jgi:uncharacterized protein (DUF1330 family)
MTAYAIANLHEVTDQETYQEYSALAGPNIAKYDGKVVILAKDIEVVEGSWSGNQVLILEFPNRAAFDKWYNADDYAPLKKMRLASLIADIIVFDND